MIKVTTTKHVHLLTHHANDMWLDGAGHRWLMEPSTSTLKPLSQSCNAFNEWGPNYWNSWVPTHPPTKEEGGK